MTKMKKLHFVAQQKNTYISVFLNIFNKKMF